MRQISLILAVCVVVLGIVGCSKGTAPNVTDEQTEALKAMEAELGMPIYPGADQDGNFASGKNDAGGEVVMGSFTTEDGMDEVMAFYRKSLKGFEEREEKKMRGSRFGGFTRVSGKNSELIVIEQPAKGPTKIAVTITRAAEVESRGG